jgi:hypothetical protein
MIILCLGKTNKSQRLIPGDTCMLPQGLSQKIVEVFVLYRAYTIYSTVHVHLYSMSVYCRDLHSEL